MDSFVLHALTKYQNLEEAAMYIDINGEWFLLITFIMGVNHFLSLLLLFKMNKRVKNLKQPVFRREE